MYGSVCETFCYLQYIFVCLYSHNQWTIAYFIYYDGSHFWVRKNRNPYRASQAKYGIGHPHEGDPTEWIGIMGVHTGPPLRNQLAAHRPGPLRQTARLVIWIFWLFVGATLCGRPKPYGMDSGIRAGTQARPYGNGLGFGRAHRPRPYEINWMHMARLTELIMFVGK